MRAAALWALLKRLLKGSSIKAAVQGLKLPFALETLYHLLQRLRKRLPTVRPVLCREKKAPASSQTDPLLQTLEHLLGVFPKSKGPLADFQVHFQRPLLE